MKLSGITYEGPSITDEDIRNSIPEDLRNILIEINGFILNHGMLHVRGACIEPKWHSLRNAWIGDISFHVLYESVKLNDVPFAQDRTGNQFLLREGSVLRLLTETDEIETITSNLDLFFEKVQNNPESILNSASDRKLEPGELFHVYPPFCVNPPGNEYTIRARPSDEVILYHADFSKQIKQVPDGEEIEITFL